MNKMLNPDGGVPLKLTDIAYMQDAFRNALEGLLRGFGKGGNVRIAGCVVTRLVLTTGEVIVNWSSGWLALHGEIFVVPSGSLNVERNDTLYWKIVRVEEAVVTLENGDKKAKREKSYATLVTKDSSDETSVADEQLKNLSDSINDTTTIVKNVETYVNRPHPGLLKPRLTITDYSDGSRGIELVGAASEQVQLIDGELARYRHYVSFEGVGTILDTSRDSMSICIIRGSDNIITVFNPDGSRLQALPVGAIKLVIRN